ncbi:MAG TPA: hypothetical protein VK858_06990 [Longimicrobiales bacterium]|nr:hypothetical protein [Longimicrobiales bacterium]
MVRRPVVLGTLLTALLSLACSTGPDASDLPSPAAGIGDLTDRMATRFELPTPVASQAVGGLLGVANSRLPTNTWTTLAGGIPGAADLLRETRGSLPEGASLRTLEDVDEMLGSEANVNSAQLSEMGSLMESYLGQAADSEAMRTQIRNIFP